VTNNLNTDISKENTQLFKKAHEKIFNITDNYRNTSHSHNEILIQTH
jgi:hypothetical protein